MKTIPNGMAYDLILREITKLKQGESLSIPAIGNCFREIKSMVFRAGVKVTVSDPKEGFFVVKR